MGNCITLAGKKIYSVIKNDESKDADKTKNYSISTKKEDNVQDKEKDKKGVNLNVVFEEIMDVKDLHIKGAMLLSETEGKPKETYETIENIAPGIVI